MNKTYSAKPSEVKRDWYVIDASDETLGRISTRIATILLGKEKPMFTNHIDCGDYVIVVNAAKIKVTGNKIDDKKYYRHSQHPSGLHTRTFKEQMEKDPTVVIMKAVRGMLPINKLTAERLKRLKIYMEEDHQHEAQKPTKLALKKGKS